MRALYRPAARDDLEQIYDVTSEIWGTAQAQRYLSQLRSAVERVLRFPRSGQVYRLAGKEYRSVRAGRHLVFYRIQGDTTVVIVRILHDRMDIPARLSDEGGG